MIISWVAPDNGGSPITAYTVYIRQSDGITFTTEMTHCDASSVVIRDNQECTIPASVLHDAPYSLAWGTPVYAKVMASNIYGDSEVSLEGNGGTIITEPFKPVSLVEVYAQRTPTTLGLAWADGPDDGGLPVLDYRVNIAVLGGEYSVLASGLTTAEYTAVDLVSGTTYEFKVESRNAYEYSPYSDSITLLAAFKPEAPVTVTTANSLDKIVLQWSMPATNGSPITGYEIYIQQHASTDLAQESVECDGTTQELIDARSCSILLSTLTAAPYALVQDESVYVSIVSQNFYGDSAQSAKGNGGLIQLVPEAPLNLANDASVTTAQNIKFTWIDGVNDGSSPVIDYDVYYDQGVGTWQLLEANVLTQYYVTQVTLTPDVTYSFKVLSRNSVGVSP